MKRANVVISMTVSDRGYGNLPDEQLTDWIHHILGLSLNSLSEQIEGPVTLEVRQDVHWENVEVSSSVTDKSGHDVHS